MRPLDVGDVAPDFSLPGIQLVDGEIVRSSYRLSDLRGAPVVLAFYPLDASKVCTEQLCSYQDQFGGFDALGTKVLGISLQGLESHEEFARAQQIGFPLLADQKDGVAAAFGTMLGSSAIRRSVWIIDAEGVIRWKHVALIGFTFRKADEIRAQILRLFPSPAGGQFSMPAPSF